MNKKGFTLIELIAVVVILSLLVFLVSKGVTKIVKDNKKDLGETQENLILEAAQLYMEDNLDDLPDLDACYNINISDLQSYFEDLSKLKTNKDLSNYYVRVCNINNEIKYELVINNE